MIFMLVTFPKLNPVIFKEEPFSPFEKTDHLFTQKWDKSDYIVFQVSYDKFSFSSGEIIAKLVDNEGRVVAEFINDVVDAGDLFQGILRVGCDVGEGLYRILLTTTGDKFKFYSNFFHIGRHENTVLIEYTCDKNKFDCIFKTVDYGYSFFIRVDCGVKSGDVNYNADDVFYTSQSQTTYLIDSIPYVTRKYTFGDSYGLPNWMADKLNRVFACEDVSLDNVSVVKNDGAKLEATSSDAYPYAGLKIELLHQYEGDSDELFRGEEFMQAGMKLELADRENTYSLYPPKTGKIHIDTFEKTFN